MSTKSRGGMFLLLMGPLMLVACAQVIGLTGVPEAADGGDAGEVPTGEGGKREDSGLVVMPEGSIEPSDGTMPDTMADATADTTVQGDTTTTSDAPFQPDTTLDLGVVGTGGDADIDASCACVTPPPLGWLGPLLVGVATATSGPLSCPERTPTLVFDGGMGVDAGAPICSSNATCAPTSLSQVCTLNEEVGYSAVSSCAAATVLMSFSSNKCEASPGVADFVEVDGPATFSAVATGVASPSTPPSPNDSPPSWQTQVIGCEPDADASTCAAGNVCIAAGNRDFSRVCIVNLSGGTDCSGVPGYKNAFMPGEVFTSWKDGRACTTPTCFCTGSCGGTATLFTDGMCQSKLYSVPQAAGGCSAIDGGTVGSVVLTNASYPSWDCGAPTTSPTGTVQPTGEVLICCQ